MNVEIVAKMANQFECVRIENLCENFLINESKKPIIEQMEIADRLTFAKLKVKGFYNFLFKFRIMLWKKLIRCVFWINFFNISNFC